MIEFRATSDPYEFNRFIELRCLWRVAGDDREALNGQIVGGRGFIRSVICETNPDDGAFIPPFLKLSMEQAQNLADALWSAGVRPSNGAGSVGQLAATQEHLETVKRFSDKLLAFVVNDNPERYGKQEPK